MVIHILNNGRKISMAKNIFMNPIRQNYAHVKSIESFLWKYGYDNIPVYSIIAFPGDTTLKLKIENENVVKWAEVVKTIKMLSKEKYLTKDEIRNISKLLNNQKNNIQDNRKHISQNKRGKKKTRRTLIIIYVRVWFSISDSKWQVWTVHRL